MELKKETVSRMSPRPSSAVFPKYPLVDLTSLAQISSIPVLVDSSVLVTGATGFIGSHLTQTLAALRVRPSLFVLDYERQDFPPGSTIYHGNLSNLYDCLRIVGRANPEIIFHLAAQPLVDTALDSVIDTMESNVRGAYNLLEACRNAGRHIKAIVWVSTDKVYGSQHKALKESSPLLGFNHPYDASKLCADLLAQTYARAFKLPLVIARSGNVYGEGDLHWDRLIPGAIRSTVLGKSFVIRSSGLLRRDYIYVSDIVRAYLLTLDGLIAGRLQNGSVFNFGASRSYTVLDVVQEILVAFGRTDLEPIIRDQARNEIFEQHVDFEQARMILGWVPSISLNLGIQKSIEWYQQYFRAEPVGVVKEIPSWNSNH